MAEQDVLEAAEEQDVVAADEQPVPSSEPSELEQLRQIVFGQAQAGLENQMALLQQEMKAGFDRLSQHLQQQIAEIQGALQDHVNHLEDRIALVDSQHEEKSADLNAYADKLSAELETYDANSRHQSDELHKRLDGEIRQLTDKFTAQHDQTLELLSQVKSELNSSKTDRKTLAKLLAAMATNLETDE